MMNAQLHNRSGAAAIFIVLLMIPLLGLLAFSVDFGFLLYVKTEMQRTADQAVLAAVQDLTPNEYGDQDLEQVRQTIRDFVALNLGSNFIVLDDDIEIGRYNSTKIYSNVELHDDGIFDTVRVAIRRDESANNSITLYFARFIDHEFADVSASSTAILQRARFIGPGTSVFPFAMEQKAWNRLDPGESASMYGDGRIEDEFGKKIPGNWGTLDIGSASNGTSELSEQIRNGLTQSDLNSLEAQNRIPESSWIDGSQKIYLNGDTGLSAGLKHAVNDVEGEMKIAPIYKKTTGHGGNLEFEIVGWGAIQVVDSSWNGSKNSRIEIRKSYIYDANLLPVNDLSDTGNVIEGAYTSPVLAD